MVVIADTSPLNYLILIDAVDVLPRLYRNVVVPQPVLEELRHSDSPQPVREWAAHLPTWVEIVSTEMLFVHIELAGLDSGEAGAIVLAQTHPGALLLMDDLRGRNEAGRRHIRTVGTLGILREAAAAGWVNLPTAFAGLLQTPSGKPKLGIECTVPN